MAAEQTDVSMLRQGGKLSGFGWAVEEGLVLLL